MEKVRIGFVGVGQMGQAAHLRNYASLPDCRVVALAEFRPELGKRVAARYDVPKVYHSGEEMLSAERPDGIVASQPFRRHGVLLPELLAADVPVFCEKPLAGSVAAGEKVLRAVQAGRSWLMVGYHKRSDPATMCAKEEIDRLKASGELGAMRYVRIVMPPGDWIAGGFAELIRTDEPLPEMRWDEPDADMDEQTYERYVQFVNYYIHQVNLMRHLLGEPYRLTYADPSGVLLAVRSESGVAGALEMAPYSTTIDWQESALVCFERGYVRVDLPAPLACNRPGRVQFFRDARPGERGGVGGRGETAVPQLPWVGAMRQQAIHFLRAIRGEMDPPCGAAEALEDLKIARDAVRLQSR